MKRKQIIINKIFKVLPIFEQRSSQEFLTYLSRLIIELSGEVNNPIIEDAIIALQGLYNKQDNITHKDVHSIVMYYVNKLSRHL